MTRARYLFDLANLCSVTPPHVGDLAVIDFAHLVYGIRAHRAARQREAQ